MDEDRYAPEGGIAVQQVAITRLLKDKASHESVLMMQILESNEELTVRVPSHKAGVLALEAHGLNDRCPLYSILLECVSQLGGIFGPVVISLDEVSGNGAAISLKKDGHTRWVSADFVELMALALHLQLPIYVSAVAQRSSDRTNSDRSALEIPTVFHKTFEEDLLAERDEGRPSQ